MLEPGSSWHVPGFFGFGFEVDWLERSVELDSGRTLNWWDVAEPDRARATTFPQKQGYDLRKDSSWSSAALGRL